MSDSRPSRRDSNDQALLEVEVNVAQLRRINLAHYVEQVVNSYVEQVVNSYGGQFLAEIEARSQATRQAYLRRVREDVLHSLGALPAQTAPEPTAGQTQVEQDKLQRIAYLKNIIDKGPENQEHYRSEIPEHFRCPITYNLISEAVQSPSGHFFESAAIELWVILHGTCPMTRQPLTLEQLKPATAHQEKVEQWKREHQITGAAAAQQDVSEVGVTVPQQEIREVAAEIPQEEEEEENHEQEASCLRALLSCFSCFSSDAHNEVEAPTPTTPLLHR